MFTLQELDVLGNWIAALATLLAVVVSLDLARNAAKLKIKAYAGERVIVTAGVEDTIDRAMISITNCCHHPAIITHISWKIGFKKDRYIVQLFNIPGYETLPKTLAQGEYAPFVIPYDLGQEDGKPWPAYIGETLLENTRWPKLYIKTLRCVISTSIGQNFTISVEKGLKDAIV